MKKLLLPIFLLLSLSSFAQQYALFGTKTMFDAFENPSQKSFTLDSSRKFSSNFFLPNFGLNTANQGSSSYLIRKLTQEGVNDTRSVPIGTGNINHFYQNSNIYLATFRLFKSYKHQKEMGFSWQIRSDAHADYPNDAIILFDSYSRFPDQKELNGIFNVNGYEQTYHQFSFTYRENYNKQLAFGLKAGVLSGILYNNLNISNSYLFVDQKNNDLILGLAGTYYSNFSDVNDINEKTFFPNFKNPGLSLSFGTNYTSKKGLFLMANIKDLGFIWWRDGARKTTLSNYFNINDIAYNQSNVNQQIKDILLEQPQSNKFVALTNAKLDVYISKSYGIYKPGLVISKNLFYKGGDIAFVNTFNFDDLSASVTPLYNLNKIFMVGLQGKYQTKNFEFFLGSDNLYTTASSVKGIIKRDASIGSGPNGASFYMGIGIKFGNVVNHPQFSDTMPGIK